MDWDGVVCCVVVAVWLPWPAYLIKKNKKGSIMLCEKCKHKKVQIVNYGSAKNARAMCGVFGTELAFDKDIRPGKDYRMRYKAPLESCEAFEEKQSFPGIMKEPEKVVFNRTEIDPDPDESKEIEEIEEIDGTEEIEE